jgi:hypothetical protein
MLIAQRLVAQAHGRIRDVVTILAGFLQLQFGVLSLSLGHVACSHLLGLVKYYYKHIWIYWLDLYYFAKVSFS